MPVIRTKLGTNRGEALWSDAQIIDGLGGDDRITGTADSQTIFGGAGNDVIRGRGGNDVLWGDGSSADLAVARGDDRFVFEQPVAIRDAYFRDSVATIRDFDRAGHVGLEPAAFDPRHDAPPALRGDILDLSSIDFTRPAHAGSHSVRPAKLGDANLDSYVWARDGDVYVDVDGAGRGEATLLAHLDGIARGDVLRVQWGHFEGEIVSTGKELLVDFEDVPGPLVDNFKDLGTYEGFVWDTPAEDDFDVIAVDVDPWGNVYPGIAGVSQGAGSFVAVNNFAVSPTTITREDGSDFEFVSGYFADVANLPASVNFNGYRDGVLVGTTGSLVIDDSVQVSVDWGLIDSLVIDHTGGIGWLAMDDLLFLV